MSNHNTDIHRSDPPVDPTETDISELEPEIDDEEINSLPKQPISFTGSTTISDPREIQGQENMFSQMMDIAAQFDEDYEESAIEKAEQEETQMQIDKETTAHFTCRITPKPLTPSQLRKELSTKHDLSEITVWIRPEPEYIEHTAVGEYRQHVDGNIVRFSLDIGDDDNTLVDFELRPDYSPSGFSYYITVDDSPMTKDGSLDADQARRLDAIKDCSPEELENILTIEEKVRSASLLLEKPLVGTETRCIPSGWMNANCEIDQAATEPLQPRYKGTFVHSESEIVLEFQGNQPTETETRTTNKLMDDITNRMMPDGFTQPTSPPSGKTDPPDIDKNETHSYEIHFASDEIKETIKAEFGTDVTGRELLHMMRKISELA